MSQTRSGDPLAMGPALAVQRDAIRRRLACASASHDHGRAVNAPRYSLVIPFNNEAGNATPLLAAVRMILEAHTPDFEVVLVDDGSTDATPDELRNACAAEPRFRLMSLPRNIGQAGALLAGLQAARGAIILTMDGDGQNDPRDFPILLALVENDRADLAGGWRQDRHDPWSQRFLSRLANAVRRFVFRDGMHDAGCQLRVFRREVIAALTPGPLLQAFLPTMVARAGFRVSEVPVRHHARVFGRPHYGLRKLWWRPFCEMVVLWWRCRSRR